MGQIDIPTEVMTTRARQAVAMSHQFAFEPIEQCANLMCENMAHQGKFVLFMAWSDGKPLAMTMCAPCVELIRGLVHR